MAYTQTDLDRINAAIASGVLSCVVNGQNVTYRSLREMERVKAIIEREVSVRPARSVYYFTPAGRRD
ncbi:phage head-tail joining protein [Aromatoleum toluclasticum]|uniref:phage head-tail joining protein n=1 Tax=Aromatoleum toluclasticum TaxID=92003 RepID=UPI00036A50FD|nr:hypothetical protein [Aromatoleum toluclasticum]